MMKYKKKGTK